MILFPVDPSANDQFQNEVVCIFCKTKAWSEIDLPSRINIQIDYYKKGVTLLREPRNVIDKANVAVIFQAYCHLAESVRCFDIGFKSRNVLVAI